MKIIYFISLIWLFAVLGGCEKQEINKEQSYAFIQPFCAGIVVGGFAGLSEKCFKIGDIVSGVETKEGKVKIRIADHNYFNDGPSSNLSYQEFLEIPLIYLEVLEK